MNKSLKAKRLQCHATPECWRSYKTPPESCCTSPPTVTSCCCCWLTMYWLLFHCFSSLHFALLSQLRYLNSILTVQCWFMTVPSQFSASRLPKSTRSFLTRVGISPIQAGCNQASFLKILLYFFSAKRAFRNLTLWISSVFFLSQQNLSLEGVWSWHSISLKCSKGSLKKKKKKLITDIKDNTCRFKCMEMVSLPKYFLPYWKPNVLVTHWKWCHNRY